MADNIEYEVSSGNVFEDLGFEDSKEMLIKAKLALKINSLLKHRGLKQKEAAKLLKTTQAKISLLSHGHLSGFSLEKLMNYLVRLDRDIKIIVKPKSRSHSVGTISVDAA